MAKVVGDIAVEVSADISPLQRSLAQGSRHAKNFGKDFTTVSKNIAKAGAVIAGGIAVASAGAFALVKNAADAGAEIERLSRIANTTPEKFQKMAAGARTVGIEQDKLADILKDVQDRIGDFLQTGGGPMADFFEKVAPQVGVTAQEFKNLSGPQALQLYMNSLQRANLSQEEMTFFMEAMSSDLTALQPLLKNNGEEMDRLGEAAADAGAIMSNEAVNGSKDLQAQLDNMTRAISTQFTQAILENKDEILELTDQITTVWIPALLGAAGTITDIVEGIGAAINKYREWKGLITSEGPGGGAPAIETPEDLDRFNRDLDGLNNRPRSGSGTGTGLPPNDPLILEGLGGDSLEGGSGLDFLADQNEQEFEIQAEHFERMRELLADFQDGKFELLTAGFENERALHSDHLDAVEERERLSQSVRMRMIAGAFNDLSSLMASENEKLFKIGKAAAIAEATVSGYQAAVDAWQKGMKVGGPPVAAAFTAASLAKTGALISSIASTSVGGGGGNSAGAAGGGTSAGVVNTQRVDLNIIGGTDRDRFVAQEVIAALNNAQRDGFRLDPRLIGGT